MSEGRHAGTRQVEQLLADRRRGRRLHRFPVAPAPHYQQLRKRGRRGSARAEQPVELIFWRKPAGPRSEAELRWRADPLPRECGCCVVDAGPVGYPGPITEPQGLEAAVWLLLSGLRVRRPGRGPHEFRRARHLGNLPEVRLVRSCRLGQRRPGRRRLPQRLSDDRGGLRPARGERAPIPAPGRAGSDRGWKRTSGGRSDPLPVAGGSVSASVTRCPQCASPRVHHLWRADMEHLTLIDQWKCVDTSCGHRWDTTVTYTQRRDEGQSGPERSTATSGTSARL